MESPLPRQASANPTQYNIDAIAKLEHDALSRRTATERVSNVITKVVGNVGFLLAQLILISGWSLANLHIVRDSNPLIRSLSASWRSSSPPKACS